MTAIFTTPTKANVKFSDIESLVQPLGGGVRKGSGSRVALEINGVREYAHRSHPGKEAKRYVVEKILEWLKKLEITP